MSLSIDRFSPQEINALATVNLSTEIIAIKMDADGGPKIVKLSKSDVTCWQLFLRFFCLGTLVNMRVHLSQVTSHLNQYDWSENADIDLGSVQYQAYLKTCSLANKALYKCDETLWSNVARFTHNKKMELIQRGNSFYQHLDVNKTIKGNPTLQIKHVEAFLHNHYRNSTIRIEDENHHLMGAEIYASNAILEQARVYIEQHISQQPVVVPVVVQAPCHYGHPQQVAILA